MVEANADVTGGIGPGGTSLVVDGSAVAYRQLEANPDLGTNTRGVRQTETESFIAYVDGIGLEDTMVSAANECRRVNAVAEIAQVFASHR